MNNKSFIMILSKCIEDSKSLQKKEEISDITDISHYEYKTEIINLWIRLNSNLEYKTLIEAKVKNNIKVIWFEF